MRPSQILFLNSNIIRSHYSLFLFLLITGGSFLSFPGLLTKEVNNTLFNINELDARVLGFPGSVDLGTQRIGQLSYRKVTVVYRDSVIFGSWRVAGFIDILNVWMLTSS